MLDFCLMRAMHNAFKDGYAKFNKMHWLSRWTYIHISTCTPVRDEDLQFAQEEEKFEVIEAYFKN